MDDEDQYSNLKSRRVTQMVNAALEEMHRRRSEYRRARSMNAVSKSMQASFQAAVVDVYDELYPYRHKVEELWTENNLNQIHAYDNQKIEKTEYSSKGGRMNVEVRTEPYRIPCEWLLTWSKDLDDVARELGFSAPFGVETADLNEGVV